MKFIWRMGIASSALMVSFLALRAVYAVSFFGDLKRGMQFSGWNSVDSNSVMQVDEDMTFEASYLFFKIGSVRFQVAGKTVYDSIPTYRLRAYIDSYSGVPFVDFHAVYDTYADARDLTCLFNLKVQRDGDSWIYTTTSIDTDRKVIRWKQSENDKTLKSVDVPLDTSYTNGVSFIYNLREACVNSSGREMKLEIPIVDDTVKSDVDLTINEKREPCDVAAFDYPLRAQRLSGHINFTGTFGITGDFVGWMAADSSAVPLRGNVKVLLGSVVVQLKEIKRSNWVPPRSSANE